MVISELYMNIKGILKNADIEDYSFDSGCILENTLDMPLSKILMNRNDNIPEDKCALALSMAKKRASGQPLQYILGEWEFYGYPFKVGSGVLIPRSDTETIIDAVKETADTERIIDLCSGSGCIAITLQKIFPHSCVAAVEYSEDALVYLKENAKLNNACIEIIKGDVLDEKLADTFSDISVIASNPPYLTADDMKALQKEVTFEPADALFGGDDGLLFYRSITKIWKKCLRKGGLIAYETGIGQENDVACILKENNFDDINFKKDLSGIIRVVTAIKS